MASQLSQDHPSLDISILGVNEVGEEFGNDFVTADRDLPWLQDVDANQDGHSDVWREILDVTYRDILLLNGQNELVSIFNLTNADLGDSTNYLTLKSDLIDIAMADQVPWNNPVNGMDVNGSDIVSSLDALIVINDLNALGSRKLQAPTGAVGTFALVDVNGDNHLAPIDALLVINYLNENIGNQ